MRGELEGPVRLAVTRYLGYAALARGLCLYLNSSFVDSYFRQFNGHTQVNATDLRILRYPTSTMLSALGGRWSKGSLLPEQEIIDKWLNEETPIS